MEDGGEDGEAEGASEGGSEGLGLGEAVAPMRTRTDASRRRTVDPSIGRE